MALVVHCGQKVTLTAIYNYKLNVILKNTFSGSLQSSHKKNSDFSQVLPWEKWWQELLPDFHQSRSICIHKVSDWWNYKRDCWLLIRICNILLCFYAEIMYKFFLSAEENRRQHNLVTNPDVPTSDLLLLWPTLDSMSNSSDGNFLFPIEQIFK